MKIEFLAEPELEFGAGQHIDIRFGISNYSPLDFESATAPHSINVGVIGDNESIEGIRAWLVRCKKEIAGKQTNRPNLFPAFPGFSSTSPFKSDLQLDDQLCTDISKSDLRKLKKLKGHDERVEAAVELFRNAIEYLVEKNRASVIVCALPMALLEALGDSAIKDGDEDKAASKGKLDFRDLLKARIMSLRTPIQLVLPATYDPSKRSQLTKLGLRASLQDEATRAWNLHAAIYYKAGGTPWRLIRQSNDLTACYMGISFYKSIDQKRLLTSVAQVFNERGEGVVVRGGAAHVSKDDRNVHLQEEDARDLVKRTLAKYKQEHKTLPARVVIHKTSTYNDAEVSGFTAAIDEAGIEEADFTTVTYSQSRLYRAGPYPPLRGTLLHCDSSQLMLYTKGSVNFFRTYPGLYVPNPLLVRLFRADQTGKFLCEELLALSKMNWNNTQFDGSMPITIRAARQVSDVLRYCSDDQPLEPRYSFYM